MIGQGQVQGRKPELPLALAPASKYTPDHRLLADLAPIRPLAVAATDDALLAPEPAAGHQAARRASPAPGLRPAPVRGRGDHDGARPAPGRTVANLVLPSAWSPITAPIRPPAVAARDDALLAPEPAAGHQAARRASPAPGLRPAPVRGRGARDGHVDRRGGLCCIGRGTAPSGGRRITRGDGSHTSGATRAANR